MTRHLFALERYETSQGQTTPELSSLPPGAGACLVAAVHLPADDVVLALVEGPDAAGWQVDRLCPAAWVEPGQSSRLRSRWVARATFWLAAWIEQLKGNQNRFLVIASPLGRKGKNWISWLMSP